uniref:ER membrane protein complex subunit 9 n=1 Tax=Equus caballus TaxID=9796 RepID=A0A3Q2LCG8_HORSE
MPPGIRTPRSTGCCWRRRSGRKNACASPTVCPCSIATWPCPSCWRSPSTRCRRWTPTDRRDPLTPLAQAHPRLLGSSAHPQGGRHDFDTDGPFPRQVDVWGAQAGLVVAGYYHANAALDDQSPGPLALKIAGRIAEFFPDAVLIMLDNQKLVPQPHVPPVIVLENHGLRWVPKDKNLVMWRDWEESRHMVGALLDGRAYQHLVDFDCHLDDIRQDWTNQQLNTQITQWVGPTNGNT